MRNTIIGALGALGMLLCAAPASAQADGDYYTFDLYNGTPWTILTFQTSRINGSYSQDWMPTRVLASDDTVAMRFKDSEDECEYWVKLTFEDGDIWQQKVDFCELETLVINEDGTMEGFD